MRFGFNSETVALLTIRLGISPMPMGRTPGFLSKGIKQPAINPLKYSGVTFSQFNFLASTAYSWHNYEGFVLNWFEQRTLCHNLASLSGGPAAPFIFVVALNIAPESIFSKMTSWTGSMGRGPSSIFWLAMCITFWLGKESKSDSWWMLDKDLPKCLWSQLDQDLDKNPLRQLLHHWHRKVHLFPQTARDAR